MTDTGSSPNSWQVSQLRVELDSFCTQQIKLQLHSQDMTTLAAVLTAGSCPSCAWSWNSCTENTNSNTCAGYDGHWQLS